MAVRRPQGGSRVNLTPEVDWASRKLTLTTLDGVKMTLKSRSHVPLLVITHCPYGLTVRRNRHENEIFEALKEEFENDLTRWQAELTKDDLAIRFLPLMYYLRQENLL